MPTETTKLIRHAALNLLARREHSPKELLDKLKHKGFQPDLIQSILDNLIEQKLLSVSRFIENYIEARRKKGFGPLHIRAELSARGISSDDIQQYLMLNDDIWFEEAKSAWQKRFKNKFPQNSKERAQHMRFLQSRGFTSEQMAFVVVESN